ncbi:MULTISPECIES: hypothetical protein [Bacillus cereus group]|uniref:hypothetical protein n=1 Tax=Bacillus cereus group TaxID=86661 RepID=UPI001965EBFA|nr:hypothetical protein [Bacillus cereus]MBM6768363.1 hypothetical protein [Bacillus cereus]
MKSLLQKTLAVIGLTASLLGMVSSVSFASISWDNNATWTGSGAKAKATAYTAKKKEPHFYKMTVRASFDDGTSKELALYDAKTSDRINVSVASKGPVTRGYSGHEWIMVGDSAYTSKEMVIK